MAGRITDMTKQDPYETSTKNLSGQIVGYARVSSAQQNLDRQISALTNAGCTKIFEDRKSGATRERSQLNAALDYLREGDTLICHSMDRLARSLPDLHALVTELTERGVTVEFIKEGQSYSTSSTPVAKLMLGLLGAIAEFERSLIRERQAEGIERAKERGVYKGRQKSLSIEQVDAMLALIQQGVPKAKVARTFGISRATVYRYANESIENLAAL